MEGVTLGADEVRRCLRNGGKMCIGRSLTTTVILQQQKDKDSKPHNEDLGKGSRSWAGRQSDELLAAVWFHAKKEHVCFVNAD